MTGGCEWRHDRKRGLRFEKSQLVKFLPRKKKVDFSLTRRGLAWDVASGGGGGSDGKVVIERLCLSLPYVEKPLKSKLIKSFVPELRSRKCFFVFRDSYVIYMSVMDIMNVLRTGMTYVYFTYSYLAM